jgi:RNA polymerase sigma factor (sigma-70 family)
VVTTAIPRYRRRGRAFVKATPRPTAPLSTIWDELPDRPDPNASRRASDGRGRKSKGPLTADHANLAARYFPLAMRIVSDSGARSRQWSRGLPDIVEAAMFALCRAARDYREDGPLRFATYAKWKITREIIASRRSGLPMPRFLPEQSAPCSGLADVDARDAAQYILASLPERHANALRLWVIEGLTQAEAATRMGLSLDDFMRLIHKSRSLMGA